MDRNALPRAAEVRKVAEIEAATVDLYARFLRESLEKGEWSSGIRPDFAAQYLHAQIGLAVSQRAIGVEPAIVKPLLEYALSVLRARKRSCGMSERKEARR